ncbi:MAG: roadblock/LC7 domain-containing protein [Candidatus Methanoperedens sp.]|nr:roadblock/LC7 domain-containing protein [Candidatus Methanoperedens sp.]
METITTMLEKILNDLQAVGGVELSAIVSKQGLLMVSKQTTKGLNSEAFAALTATLYMSAESTTMRLGSQRPKSIIVETEDKHLITYTAGPDALIVVLVGNEGYIGLILNELKKATEKVKKLI